MEEAVVVLCAAALVVFAAVTVVVAAEFGVVVGVEGVGGEGPGFDGGAEGLGAHGAAGGVGLGVDEAVLAVLIWDFGVRACALGAERDALGCGSGGGVSDCEHGDDGADNDRGGSRAFRADQGVAVAVVGFHADGGHGEIGAVDGNHG